MISEIAIKLIKIKWLIFKIEKFNNKIIKHMAFVDNTPPIYPSKVLFGLIFLKILLRPNALPIK